MRAQDHIVAVSLAALAALAAAPALASPTYPGIIQETLDAKCVPSCTICHRDTSGRLGTVIKPFGVALMSVPYNLVSKDEGGLRSALKALENVEQTRAELDQMLAQQGLPPLEPLDCETYRGDVAPIDDPNGRWVTDDLLWLNGDTDCDGMNDIAELRAGRDPNTKGEGNLCANYGCGARIDPHPKLDPTGFLAAVGVAGLLGAIWRRRKKAQR